MSDTYPLSAALSNFYHLALLDVFASLVKVGLFARMTHRGHLSFGFHFRMTPKGKQLLGETIVVCWKRQWHPTPVLLPGKSHGWRSLVGCSPWGCKELDTTKWLHFHFQRLSRNFDWQREKFVQHRHGICVYISKQSEWKLWSEMLLGGGPGRENFGKILTIWTGRIESILWHLETWKYLNDFCSYNDNRIIKIWLGGGAHCSRNKSHL